MKDFVDKHRDKIVGTLSCFDRIIFKGYLPLTYPKAMVGFLQLRGVRLKEFKPFVLEQADRLKQHAQKLAHRSRRPYHYIDNRIRKEDFARSIARRDGITQGLVCVLSAVEPCGAFQLLRLKRLLRLIRARRRCLFLYFYWLDPLLGFFHVRIQTWFPFTIQVYVNAHEWLARSLERRGVRYRRLDNAFTWFEDPLQAQRCSDRFVERNWPRVLERLACRVNPLLRDLLKGLSYYWVIDQPEYATDVLFKSRAAPRDLYPRLVRHATLCFHCEDVLSFLGKKLNPQFAGELGNDYKRRVPGVRVKHRIRENWIKMYDKHGSIVRVETVINRSTMFKVFRRHRRRDGNTILGWNPMNKGVSNLYRYAEVSRAANQRYLRALAVVDDPALVHRSLHQLAEPVSHKGRSLRGFNPASKQDIALFAAVLRGEHALSGFRNKDLRKPLRGLFKDRVSTRKQSVRVSRLLKRLHVHKGRQDHPRPAEYRRTTQRTLEGEPHGLLTLVNLRPGSNSSTLRARSRTASARSA